MKAKTRLFIIAALLLCGQISKAQIFNTISEKQSRNNTKLQIAPNAKEASPEGDTSSTCLRMEMDSASAPKNKKTERTRYPLVSYPLRQEKLVVTSPFGWRRDPFDKTKTTFHAGIDLRARFEPVYAMLAGKVIAVGNSHNGGLVVTLQHPGDITVSYMHLSRSLVAVGDIVQAGQPVCISGGSGARSTAPHLHCQLKIKSRLANPANLLHIISSNI